MSVNWVFIFVAAQPPRSAGQKTGFRRVLTTRRRPSEFTSLAQQANADWLARMELERELAAELASKLTGAKSLPDVFKVYQDWMIRRMEITTKDSQKFYEQSQKLAASMMSGSTTESNT
jgi:hypothetical protein